MLIKARNIPEAHYRVCKDVMEFGYEYTIDKGSFVGIKRKQLESLTLIIMRPEERPLSSRLNGIQLSDDKSIETYFLDYLVNPEISTNEQYTYGKRLAPNLDTLAQILIDTPYTNQAVLEIGQPSDIYLFDPPCLRVLSWKMTQAGLQLTSFWRSWDVYGALPTNLGGLQLLNEMIAEWVNQKPGPLIAYSDGAHVYEHSWGML